MGKLHQELHVNYHHDYYLYGLQTTVPEYKLAWELNRALGIRLKKAPDWPLDGSAETPLFVSNFIFTDTHRTFRLLKNRVIPDRVAFDRVTSDQVTPDRRSPLQATPGSPDGALPTSQTTTYLLSELKQWPYLLQIQDLSHSLNQDALLVTVGNLSAVKQAARIALSSVNHKENLLF